MIQSNPQRDRAIIDHVLREHRSESVREVKPDPDRMRALARQPRRPALTEKRIQGLAVAAEILRSRLKYSHGIHAIRPEDREAARAALAYLEDTALFYRRHR